MIFKNYIIIAHDHPEQLNRLITRLDDGYAYFYVHIDRRKDIAPFLHAVHSAAVTWVEDRAAVYWGSFGLTQSFINSLQQIIKDGRLYYTILLSNQCYPIANTAEINQYIAEYQGYEHIDVQPAEQIWPSYEERIYGYSIRLGDSRHEIVVLPYFFKSPLRIYISRLLKIGLICVKKRKTPPFRACSKSFTLRSCAVSEHFGGSNWWAFTPGTIEKILRFIDIHSDFIAFHRDTHASDELFFHTILHELTKQDDTIKINPSLTYVDWSRSKNGSPTTLTEVDLEQLMIQSKQGKLFARKFDVGSNILDLLDGYAERSE